MEQEKQIGQLRGAGILIVVGIISGAFGAHALGGLLDAPRGVAYETASRYALVMGVAILAANATGRTRGIKLVQVGAWLFSGSIFILVFGGAFGWGWTSVMGPVTPLGGTLMIAGWVWWCIHLQPCESGEKSKK